jgi:hypothetical protein
MKKIKRTVFTLILLACMLSMNIMVYAKSVDTVVPFAYGTKSVSDYKTKTLRSNEGNLNIGYTISGLYVYNLNTGEITRAYNGSLKDVNIISAPHDGDWELIVKDIVIGKPTISSGGASAKYPVRFHVYARFLPGGVGLWKTIDFGIVNDYGTAEAK